MNFKENIQGSAGRPQGCRPRSVSQCNGMVPCKFPVTDRGSAGVSAVADELEMTGDTECSFIVRPAYRTMTASELWEKYMWEMHHELI